MTVEDLPTVNATLNGVATIFLIAGWRAIKAGNPKYHAGFMTAALVASAAFLTSYVIYHYHAGSKPYEGEGALRIVYYAILITHVPLATLMVPFIVAAVFFALRRQFKRHTMITKRLWPVWMYVSITGVIIYLMLYML